MTVPLDQPESVSASSIAHRAVNFEPRVVRRRVRDDTGFWLVLSGLLLSCFAGHWQDMGVPLPIDRALLLTGLAIEWARAGKTNTLPRISSTAVLLAAAAAWAAVSFIGSPVRTSDGFYFLLDLYLIPSILFVSAPILFGTRHRRFAFTAAFAVFGLYLGLTAITQTLGLSSLVFPGYILDPSVGLHQDRARGPYVEAVDNGMMLIFSGTLGALLATTAVGRRWRIIGSVAALACAVGCALTLTRAIWLAGGVALVIALIAIPGLRRRLPTVLVGLVLLASAFVAIFPSFLTSATARGEAQSPIWDRLDVAQGATLMGVENPLFGVGWNQAGLRMSEFVRLGADYPVTAASANLIPHNVFLSRFAELGIPGTALWLAGLAAVVLVPVVRRGRKGYGAWRVVLLTYTSCWLIIANFGPVNYSEPQYILYLVGGITASGRALMPLPWDWSPRSSRFGARRHPSHSAG